MVHWVLTRLASWSIEFTMNKDTHTHTHIHKGGDGKEIHLGEKFIKRCYREEET